MKKMIVLIGFILSVISASHAQCTLPYQSLSAFNNDTTVFVKYNFSDRKECYVGKTMADLISDLGIPIQSFLVSCDEHWSDLYSGIYLHLYPYSDILKVEDNNVYKNEICIEWETSLEQVLLDSLKEKADRHKWTSQIYDLLKDRKIKSIGVVRKI